MNQIYRQSRLFFAKNYDAIKLGVLFGLLIANIMLINNQAQTMRQILNINERLETLVRQDAESRETARAEAEKRDERIIAFLRCIALIPYGERDETNFNECVEGFGTVKRTQNTPAPKNNRERNNKATTVPTPQSIPPKQEPTTSEPPEPPEQPQNRGLIGGTIDSLDTTLSDLMERLGL